ncbi:beta-galactosidase trimerization domain-containing protein [Phaeodactylibacter xiamenensis]|uniref:beta-galactosidase trimerization domain-containing protein n=1 Tax=Phaeodactylibacter xiamenensis TaxID=1524460 RepID=UPI003CCC142E
MKSNVLIFSLICWTLWLGGQTPPSIGAQVYIEPGQTAEEIEGWFSIMAKYDMTVCRIRMDETHMAQANGSWDFTLYDAAFDAAERHGVRVFATLFPANTRTGVGGFKFPKDAAHLASIERYIGAVVPHFSKHPALFAWVLQNEPGVGGILPKGAYTEQAWSEWKTSNPLLPDPNGFMREDFREPEFIRQHTTAYLSWIAAEIEKYDSGRHLHVNSHMLFVTLPEYEFPAWRKLLSSFGASMHPSWHFGYFERDQYPVAMGANNDIIRAGAGEKPFWVTELQGGNNSYSGFNPMTPSAEEIEQWLWGSLFSGAEGIIFWCLNPRKAGLEAGEWSLLDFLDEPTDRMGAAGEVAAWLDQNPDFAKARPQTANIHVLYNRESMYLQRDREVRSAEVEQYFEGRLPGATIKSVLAHYEALLEQGITPEIGSMDDFDWKARGRAGAAVIIPHQIVIPRRHWEGLKTFVAEGGQLLLTGLSAHFDEYGQNIMTGGFPFREVLGGQVREFRVMGNTFLMSVDEKQLPAHLWQGTLAVDAGAVLSYAQDSLPVALQHQYGQGRTLWIPAPIGLAAWQQDNTPLAQLLQAWLANGESPQVRFRGHHPGVTMKVMASESGLYTMLINTNDYPKQVALEFAELRSGQILYDSAGAECQENRVLLPPNACVVLFWEKQN